MKKSNKYKYTKDLLPYPVIKGATEGDIEAIQIILQHYQGYILKLSTRRLYDEYGYPHYCVDETLKNRLEARLITKILQFDLMKYQKQGKT